MTVSKLKRSDEERELSTGVVCARAETSLVVWVKRKGRSRGRNRNWERKLRKLNRASRVYEFGLLAMVQRVMWLSDASNR